MSNTYCLPLFDNLLTHGLGWQQPQTFHDIDAIEPHGRRAELTAQIASQDYFAMVATTLDRVSHHLKTIHHSDYFILEDIIDDLLYLQSHYKITKK